MGLPEQIGSFWDHYIEENGSTSYMKRIFPITDFGVTLLLLYSIITTVICVLLVVKHNPPPVFRSIQQDSKTPNESQQTGPSEYADDSFLDRLLNWDAPIPDEELSYYPYLCRFCKNETTRLGAIVLGSLFYPLYLVVQFWWTCCIAEMVLPQSSINQSHLWKFYSMYLACRTLDIVPRMALMLLIQIMTIWMLRAQTRYMRIVVSLRLGPKKDEKEDEEESEKHDGEDDEDDEDEKEDNEEDSEDYYGSDDSLSSTGAQYTPSSPTPSRMDPLSSEERLDARLPSGLERPHWAGDAC